MNRHGTLSYKSGIDLRPTLLSCCFYILGTLFGCIACAALSDSIYISLKLSLLKCVENIENGISALTLLNTLFAYFRSLLVLVVLYFCTIGPLLLAVNCLVEGFTLGFTACAVAAACGRGGILLSLSVLGLRCLFVIPVTLYLGCLLIKHQYNVDACSVPSFIRNVFVCACFLLMGTALDLLFVPKLFHMTLNALL